MHTKQRRRDLKGEVGRCICVRGGGLDVLWYMVHSQHSALWDQLPSHEGACAAVLVAKPDVQDTLITTKSNFAQETTSREQQLSEGTRN